MRRISSRTTFWLKRVMPFVWLAVVVLFPVLPSLIGWWRTGQFHLPPIPFLVPQLLFMLVLYFIWKKTIFDLVDEVLEDGDSLVIRNSGQQERIAFCDIVNVSYSPFMGANRVTLLLRKPSSFGTRIHFSPPQRLFVFPPFFGSRVVDDLIKRIDATRRP